MEQRALLDGAPVDLIASDEFRVNTWTDGNQQFHAPSPEAVALDADGDAVIVWASQNQEGNDWGVFAQRFASDGSRVGSEFQVNRYTTGEQKNATVAMDADGDFVVTWSSFAQDGSNFGVYARLFNAAGMPRTGEFRVNSTSEGYQRLSTVSMDSQGNFIIVWGQENASAQTQIMGRMFNSDGVPRGDEFQINEPTNEPLVQPHVASNPQGEFVVAWERGAQPTQDIYARTFSPDGTPRSGEFKVHEFSNGQQIRPTVAMSGTGQIVIAWYNQITQDDAGAIVPRDAYMRRFTRDGVPLAPEVLVNAAVSLPQQRYATVAMDAAGNFTIAWAANFQETGFGDSFGVYMQAFSAAGEKQGGETHVNVTTFGSQTFPAIGMDDDGDFIVAWSSKSQDASEYGVYARRYARNVDAAPPTVANVYVANDDHAIVEGEVLVQQPSRLAVTFSEGIDATATSSVQSQWRLIRNGVDESHRLALATYLFDGAANRHQAMLDFQEPLPSGDYVLRALPAIRDYFGQSLDGNYDGVGGDPFERSFTITAPTEVGDEFRVNVTTEGNQTFLDGAPGTIARDAAGNFFVVWTGAGNPTGVWGRRYNAAGEPLTSEFLISDPAPAQNQRQATVAMNDAGYAVVTWTGQDDDGDGVRARRFAPDGVALGPSFVVNSGTNMAQEHPSVAMNALGEFAVVWQSKGRQDSSGFEIQLQRFNASGSPIGDELRVNNGIAGDQSEPHVAMNVHGEVVVTWTSPNQDLQGGAGVYARRFSAAEGRFVGGEFRVNTVVARDQNNSAAAIDSSGHVVVVWQSNEDLNATLTGDIYAQRYDARGVALGGPILAHVITAGVQSAPTVAIDANGDFVIAWQSLNSFSVSLTDVGVRRFSWNGEPQGSESLISDTAPFNHQVQPSLAIDAQGDYLLAWTSLVQDGSGAGIYAQRFESFVNARPLAVSGGPYEVVEGAALALKASQSSDPDAGQTATLRFDWDLDNDGAFDDVVNAGPLSTVTWSQLSTVGLRDDGLYPLRVRVTDVLGATSIAEATLVVRNAAPSGLALIAGAVVNEGSVYTLRGSFADAGGDDAHELRVLWGDGSSEIVPIEAGARDFEIEHVYLDNRGAPFAIEATVADDDEGESAVAVTSAVVRNVAPQITSYQLSQSPITEGRELTIEGTYQDAGQLDSHDVSIDWGDGTFGPAVVNRTTKTFTATHVYADNLPAPATIDMIISDFDDGFGVATTSVLVENVAPDLTALNVNASVVAVGQTVTLTGAFTDPGLNDVHRVVVNWGDNSTPLNIILPAAARTFAFQHVFTSAAAARQIVVSVRDDDAGIDGASLTVQVIACSQHGDTDFNCAVDLNDLNAVRNNFGAGVPGGPQIPGDAFPFDGVVDLNDLNAVRNNFGASVPTPSASLNDRVSKERVDLSAADFLFSRWTAPASTPLEKPRRRLGT